jgi:hypothetical protein
MTLLLNNDQLKTLVIYDDNSLALFIILIKFLSIYKCKHLIKEQGEVLSKIVSAPLDYRPQLSH